MSKRDDKKQEILEKSFYVMYRKGFNGTGVKDLADAAGIPKGSLYNYFASKEEYAQEALYYYFNTMSKPLLALLETHERPPLLRIKDFYTALIKKYDDPEKFSLGCFIGNMTQELGGSHPKIRSITDSFHTALVEKMRLCLMEAQENGELTPQRDIDALSRFIISSWQGSVLTAKPRRDIKILKDFYRILEERLLT